MQPTPTVNDFVIRFANVNGTGSASANTMFAKSVFRMGIPVSAKNIFPSNIQGLPTWYEVRVSEAGWLGRREGINIMVSINPQSLEKDILAVQPGGYFIYDNTKPLYTHQMRDDVNFIGIPLMKLSNENFENPRLRQLLKNMIYVGAISELLQVEKKELEKLLSDQFKGKEKVIEPNIKALGLGINYIREYYPEPFPLKVERRNLNQGKIMLDGNACTALGAVYGGATVMAWYPITPSTSVADSFEKYAMKLRKTKDGKNKFAILQAEDELAAIGVVIGAAWNGARAFTATSGPGVSLMNEFLGLAYFAEIPSVLINVQRGGPSTGMPTRTQQADIISSIYASHGDTKHILLWPSTPTECFEMSALAFDLADRLQTPIILMSDLDLGMNDHVTDELKWDDNRTYDRGKVLNAKELDEVKEFGRYLDVDGDGIPYRTYPGIHPTKGSFFTRGTSRDEYARYTEDGAAYVRNVNRLIRKWHTAATLIPQPQYYQEEQKSSMAILFFGTTAYSALEALSILDEEEIALDAVRIKACPFPPSLKDFINQYECVFVIEQNRDAQMRTVLINELDIANEKLISVLQYDGMPITADNIAKQVREYVKAKLPITA